MLLHAGVADRRMWEPLWKDLTRERDVLRLMAQGFANAEIAEQLFISEATVKTHASRLFAKLNVRDRSHAIVLAYESGLVEPGSIEI